MVSVQCNRKIDAFVKNKKDNITALDKLTISDVYECKKKIKQLHA